MKLRKPTGEQGITLIEILIAVSLMSLLTLGILVAMRIGFNTMDKTDRHLIQNRRVANARRIIENEIAGFEFTTADWSPKPREVSSVTFAQWEGESMRFVTGYSLQDGWRGRPQIAALQVIPGENGVGGVRLIVNETPYTGPVQAGQSIVGVSADKITGVQTTVFAPIEPGAQSFVLADRLRYCRFTYLERRPTPPLRLWRPDWVQIRQLPLGVRIDMAPLDARPAELHVTSVTVPLFVNRSPFTRYTDEM